MDCLTSSWELQDRCLTWKHQDRSIAVTPTMGCFHAGHEALMRKGRELADVLVVTLFVNPTQFGPAEDLAAYPRKPEEDEAIARAMGADILFMPSPEDMYFPDHSAWVEVPDMAATLCGKSRPTHFRGVCTVVTKLFMLTQPSFAVFGEKDWQQLAILRRMTRDLFIPVELVGVPIVREPDGLALSSRNAYLTPQERAGAPHLFKGLSLARDMAAQGVTDTAELDRAVRQYWAEYLPGGRVDYLEFADPVSLTPVSHIQADTLIATAVHMGRARLIDNVLIRFPGS